MRVEISESAHNDVLDGYWFYNRQEPGLGEYFFRYALRRNGVLAALCGDSSQAVWFSYDAVPRIPLLGLLRHRRRCCKGLCGDR